MDNAKPAVEVRNITIQFGALKANRDVSFSVKEKEFFGLIGPNGAGKTTMFNAMTGGVVPVEGDILFNGTSVLKKRPDQICHIGISRTYQNIRLFSQMTVEENVEIGLHAVPQYSRLAAFLGLPVVKKVERESKERADELLNRFGLFSQKDMKAGSLPYAMQRKLEIARALATKPKFLLLDEPAAGMNNDECNELVELLKGVHKDFDLTTILIEHHIDLVVNLCDRLCVLNLGEVLAQGEPEKVQTNPDVIKAYLGDRRQWIDNE